MFDMQRQTSLRNREVPIAENRKMVPNTSAGKQKNGVPLKNQSKVIPKPKSKEKKVEDTKHVKQASTSFSVENEIAKIKIAVPLSKLFKKLTISPESLKC